MTQHSTELRVQGLTDRCANHVPELAATSQGVRFNPVLTRAGLHVSGYARADEHTNARHVCQFLSSQALRYASGLVLTISISS